MSDSLILIAILYFALGFFEIQFPADREQNFRGRLRNIVLTGILIAGGVATTGIIYALLPFGARALPDHGIIFSILALFSYALLTDFIFYWYHRIEHSVKFIWPIHELHHSDAELNATTSLRTYWLERPLQTLLIFIPTNYVIGIDERAIILLPILLTTWLFFTHANLKLRLGPLTPIICGPQLHRLHHSILPEHQDKNFAQFFPFIDILFGTYYAPSHDEFPKTGTPGLNSDAPIKNLLIRPFYLWRMYLRKSVIGTKI